MTTEERLAAMEWRVAQLESHAMVSRRDAAPEWRPSRSVETIIAAVCAEFDLSRQQLLSETRIQRIVEPRQVAMLLTRTLTNLSLNEIGQVFGGRDHGTVLHAVNVISNRMVTEPALRAQVSLVREALKVVPPEIVSAA